MKSEQGNDAVINVELSKKYGKNLQGMKKIAFVTDLTTVCNWFLGSCALTWASAVLLGAYIQSLCMWDYYDVSLLLFFEGLRFGLAAFLRLVGYRLSDFTRWSLQSIAFFLPLGMGGFAVLSVLPPEIQSRIHAVILGQPVSDTSASDTPRGLTRSLKIFYGVVLLNAFILLLGSSVAGVMRQRYVKSNLKSLCKYHDKMLDSSTSWLRPTVDLDFAFQIQGSQYRNKERPARYVCKNYTDLIWYLYIHEKGVEAADAALSAEDRYVREAAANIIGFWAILETEVKGVKPIFETEGEVSLCTHLCFQREMLSKLADIAAESYGTLGTAAAWSFMLLLKSVELELIGVVANVRSKSTGTDLIDILLGRTIELLHPQCPPAYNLSRILQEKSHAHIYALSEYLRRLQGTSESSDSVTAAATFIDAQRVQLVQRIKNALPELVKEGNVQASNESTNGSDNELIKSLNNKLSMLLPSIEPADHKNYDSDIKSYLIGPPFQPAASHPIIKAGFILLFNIAVPLVCLGVGFIVSALLSH